MCKLTHFIIGQHRSLYIPFSPGDPPGCIGYGEDGTCDTPCNYIHGTRKQQGDESADKGYLDRQLTSRPESFCLGYLTDQGELSLGEPTVSSNNFDPRVVLIEGIAFLTGDRPFDTSRMSTPRVLFAAQPIGRDEGVGCIYHVDLAGVAQAGRSQDDLVEMLQVKMHGQDPH